ncbi:MAG: C4-dicarboxylate ABC transporter substrate-binding protein [Rhodobacteraceae bacterium]|nr:C4-dicarboxylate ABC transporter substrate-binding protein [Paracoccaceae bacterium]
MRLLTTALAFGAALFAQSAAAQLNLTAETTAGGGPPGLSMLNLAEVAQAAGVANLQLQTGQTLTNVVLNVAEGRTDIGNAPLLLVFLLSHGRGPFSSLGEEQGAALASNLRALYPYNLGAYSFYAFDSKRIDGWGGIAGHMIFNGPPQGGALTGARQLVQLVTGMAEGSGYTAMQVNWGQAEGVILGGTVDAAIAPESHPSQRITAMAAAGRVTLYSTPREVWESEAFQRWANSPGNAPVTFAISALGYGDNVTVVSEDDQWRSVNITGAEIVNASMEFETARALTAAYIAGLDAFRGRTPFTGNMGLGELDARLSGFCGPNPLRYHPGAIAAWEEAGYTVPDCARP